jgi:glyoxylase-like metal-dependent hydrolase (beta-lactamase superfamily II)
VTNWSCAACGVENREGEHPPAACAICDDERQYVPRSGQAWFTPEAFAGRVSVRELEPGILAVTSEPGVGIGQQSLLVVTPHGNLLWDPIGVVDADAVLAHGPVVAIATSHPHMFGAQVSWSRALGGVPILVAEADREWVLRDDAAIEYWSGERDIVPGVALRTVGGHFPGSAVAYVTAADGATVLLSGDTVFPSQNGTSATFMRSYPNAIPLSAAVVDRVANAIGERDYDRLYGNLGGYIEADARAIVRRSADRYMAWVRGDHDHLT